MQGYENLSVSRAEAEALLAAHDGDVALLFLYLRHGGTADHEAAARALCRTRAEMANAWEKLSLLGLAGSAPSVQHPLPAEELPEYTAEEIAAHCRNDPGFSGIVTEAQRVLGRVLSSSDLRKLFGIYDHLALPPDVILLLLNHCVNTETGNPPSMRQIEKEAYAWANREILTYEQAEEFIASSRRRRERIYQLSQQLGISGRPLSPTERKYLSGWLDMGFGDELIEMAYDRTVTNTGALKWSYMNGILKSWHEKGLHTPQDVRDRDVRRGGRQKQPADSPRDLGRLLDELDRI